MKRSSTTRNRREQHIKGLKFSYDKLNDLLYVYKENSSVYSNVMIGEFHLEFNKDWEVVGIEVLKASEILGEYGIPKKILENIQKVNLKVVSSNNSLIVFLIIQATEKEAHSATITMNNLEAPIMQQIAEA